MKIDDAKKLLVNFEIEYSGTGEYIVSQSPEAKTKLEDKSKVRLMLGTKQVKK